MSSLPQCRTTLPQELVDHIIDHYHDDIETLRTLALVSKSWLIPARHHIFHTISVDKDAMQQSDLSPVVELLKAGPSVCLSVREFILDYGDFTLSMLVSVIHELQNLRLLSLDCFTSTIDLPTPPRARLPRGLETLRIKRGDVDEGIHWLIGLFPFIKELELRGIWFSASTIHVPSESQSLSPSSSREPRRTRIDTLTYSNNGGDLNRLRELQKTQYHYI